MESYSVFRTLSWGIDWLVSIYSFMIIVRTLLSWMGPMPRHPLILLLKRFTDPVLRLVHRTVPFAIVSGIDISPMIVLLLLHFLRLGLVSILARIMLPL
jgi:YggT family protein